MRIINQLIGGLHSTESALLRVHNDLLRSIDQEGGAILVLLDLSAAFDTIDHDVLIDLLEKQCGITGTALRWFRSYISERFQSVQIGQAKSAFIKMVYGVPQGSVLGPILFTLYTSPLGAIIRRHNIDFHFYADDTQLYVAFRPRDCTSRANAVAKVEACVADIRAWMRHNKLELNDEKTELLVVSTQPNKTGSVEFKIGDDTINVSDEPPRNLGVYFDAALKMDHHIRKTSNSINSTLYKIGKIRKFLDKPTCEMLINSLVTLRGDYCNSLLFGATDKSLNLLQRQQNRAARIITFTPKFEHISGVRRDLHWLPIKERIEFKILMICFKALNNLAPIYISDLIKLYQPRRALRSASLDTLEVPKTRLKTFGDRAFSAAAPVLWNALPHEIRKYGISEPVSLEKFKTLIKTHLFRRAYGHIPADT